MYIYQNGHPINNFNMKQWRCHNWVKKKKIKEKEKEKETTSFYITVSHSLPPITFTQRWVDPLQDFRHFQAVFLQALPDFEKQSAWNGSLIQHEYYFPLLFLNPQHNVLQMLSEEEMRRGTSTVCVFKAETQTRQKSDKFLKGWSKRHQKMNEEVI